MKSMSRVLSVLLSVAVAVAVLMACSGPQRGKPPLNGSSAEMVEWEWRYNERVVSALLNGGWHEEDQVLFSFKFFERLTGILIRGNFATYGIFPTPGTREDFEQIQSWYAKNRASLCWDYNLGTVKKCNSS